MPVYILHELVVPAGNLGAVRALLDDKYVPNARARGAQLEFMCTTPPIELDDDPTTLMLLWSLPDAAAVWAMKRQGDPAELHELWGKIDELLVGRSRRFLQPVDAVPSNL
jgi:hypothetical protein